MKIAILIEKVEFGGIQMVGFNLAKSLKSRGHDVVVAHGKNLIGDFLPGIEKVQLGKMIKYIWKIPYISPSFIFRLRKLLDNFQPDIIQSMGFPPGILSGMITYKRKMRIVVISATRIRRGYKPLNTILINKFINKIILTSDYHKSIFPLKIPNNKVVIIPNMVNMEDFNNFNETKEEIKVKLKIQLDKKLLLIAGRLIKSKRIDLFLQLIKKLSLMDQDVFGIVAGDGEEKKRLIDLANELNIKPYIRFIGPIDNINKYLYISDLLVHTSESEIQPMILLEAGAAGIPAVCSNIGGNRTIVKDQENGIIIKYPDDIEGYSKAIINLLNDGDKYLKMSKKAQEVIRKEFDESVIIHKFEELYSSLI